MPWRQVVLTSSYQANDFLLKEIDRLNIRLSSKDFHNGIGFSFRAWYRKEISNPSLIAVMSSDKGEISYLKVSPDHRGKCLGLMGVKACVAYAYEKGLDKLHLINIHWNGPSFWPSLGAVRLGGDLPDVGNHIEAKLLASKDRFGGAVGAALQEIVEISRVDKLAAWRNLSQSRLKFSDGTSIKEEVFHRLCYASNMVIDLKDPISCGLLTKHIGGIPDFSFRSAPVSPSPSLQQNAPAFAI